MKVFVTMIKTIFYEYLRGPIMRFYQKHKKLSTWITAFFFLAAVIIFRELLMSLPQIWSGVKTVLSIMSPFIIGFVIAFILYIPSVKLESLLKKTSERNFLNRHSRGISVLSVYLLGFAVIGVILVLVLPWIVRNLINLYEDREIYYDKLVNFIYSRCDENGTFFGIDPTSITEKLNLEKLLSKLDLNQLTSVANGVYQVGSTIIESILAIFSSIYMLISRESLIRSVGRLLAVFTARKNVTRFHGYLSKISGIFYTYIYSALLDALVVAVACTIAFLIIGIKYAPLFGFIVGIANLIPYFGAIICGVGVSVFVLVSDGVIPALITAASILVIQQIDSNIIQPRIVGQTVGIQPLYTLMAITLGGGLFGFWGILLGVPIAASIQLIVSDLMDIREAYLTKKEAADSDESEDENESEEPTSEE